MGPGKRAPSLGPRAKFALWSHDGSKLAFLRAPNNVPPFSLWVVNADGSGLVNLTGDMPIDPPGDPTTVSWAPDGGSMAFASLVSGKGLKLFYVRSDGTSLHRLLESDLSVQQPVWSPDGATIVFKGSLSGAKLGLYSINADGSGLRLLTRAQGDTAYSFTFPQWSPDGRRLLYYAGGGDHDIWVVNADGSDEQNLTSGSEADNYWPAWSPDGSRIAYQVSRDGNRTVDVVVMDADGSHPRTLSKQGFDINPMPISWSPDGTQILVSACIADSPICSTNYVADFAIAVDALGLKPPQQIATISGLGRNLSWQRVAP